jgi:hypothetical protein
MSELGVLSTAAIITGIVVGMSAFFIFQIPDIFSIILGFSSTIVFFIIILWGTFVHYTLNRVEIYHK